MKKVLNFSLFIFAILFLVSCQKETSDPGNDSPDITGDWKFISQEALIKVTALYTDGMSNFKSVTTTTYTTVDNTGEIKIEGDKIAVVDMSYRIETTSKADMYENGVFFDSVELPFGYTVPTFNSTATYKKIGSDSIFFDGGSLSFIQTGSTTPSNQGGMKYKLEGNKLVLYTHYTATKTDIQQGTPIQLNEEALVSVNLERK